MFVFMCILWSFWSSNTISEWLGVMSVCLEARPIEFIYVLAASALLIAIGIACQYLRYKGWAFSDRLQYSLPMSSMLIVSVTTVLIAIGLPGLHYKSGMKFYEFIQSFKEDRLSSRDEELMERGYYENLLGMNKFSKQLWESGHERPEDWPMISESEAVRITDSVPKLELRESVETTFKRAELKTNRWGMRDKDYDLKKSANIYRIAILGSSYVFAEGVANDESFESIVESRLNREYAPDRLRNYEILNLAIGGFGLIEFVAVLDKKALRFMPDAVFCVVHGSGKLWLMDTLVWIVQRDIVLPYPEFNEILTAAGVSKEMGQPEIERSLTPYIDTIIKWGYHRIVSESRQHGAVPVWIFLPKTEFAGATRRRLDNIFEWGFNKVFGESEGGSELPMWIHFDKAGTLAGLKRMQFLHLKTLAQEAGFVIMDLNGVYDGHETMSIRIEPWDRHPNTLGHQLIADRLYQEMIKNERVLNLDLSNQKQQGNKHE